MNYVVSEVELCLCSRCANAFYGSSVHRIYRSDPHQVIKHECDFCRIHILMLLMQLRCVKCLET